MTNTPPSEQNYTKTLYFIGTFIMGRGKHIKETLKQKAHITAEMLVTCLLKLHCCLMMHTWL